MNRRDFLRGLGIVGASVALPKETLVRNAPDGRRLVHEVFYPRCEETGHPFATRIIAIESTACPGTLHRVEVHFPKNSVLRGFASNVGDQVVIIEQMGNPNIFAAPVDLSLFAPVDFSDAMSPLEVTRTGPLLLELTTLSPLGAEPVEFILAFAFHTYKDACA